jgi:hypothetical protein
MISRRLVPLLVLATAILAAPAGAASIKAPPTGGWKFGGTGNTFRLGKGTTKKTRAHLYVSAFSGMTPGDDACAQPPVRFRQVGKVKLVIATRGGYDAWAVGHNTPTRNDGVTVIASEFKVGSATKHGTFRIIWDYSNPKRVLSAAINLPGTDGKLSCGAFLGSASRVRK